MKPNIDAVKNGDAFTSVIETNLSKYDVVFSPENLPTVEITYLLPEGIEKTATFMLDGYDAQKNIGYKLATLDDKSEWEQARSDGNLQAPDLNDASIIQDEAAKYKYPIIFICIYNYQVEFESSQIADNTVAVYKELYDILSRPELMQWAKNLGYDSILLEKLYK